MRLRWVAFLIAVIVAMTPVINALCAMDCSHTPHTRTVTAHCHDAARDESGVTLRRVPPPCHHDCTSSNGAILSSVSGRSVIDPVAGGSAILVQPMVGMPHVLRRVPQDSPPGRVGQRTPSLLAVLRI